MGGWGNGMVPFGQIVDAFGESIFFLRVPSCLFVAAIKKKSSRFFAAKFAAIRGFLQRLDGPALLVFDNIENPADEDLQELTRLPVTGN